MRVSSLLCVYLYFLLAVEARQQQPSGGIVLSKKKVVPSRPPPPKEKPLHERSGFWGFGLASGTAASVVATAMHNKEKQKMEEGFSKAMKNKKTEMRLEHAQVLEEKNSEIQHLKNQLQDLYGQLQMTRRSEAQHSSYLWRAKKELTQAQETYAYSLKNVKASLAEMTRFFEESNKERKELATKNAQMHQMVRQTSNVNQQLESQMLHWRKEAQAAELKFDKNWREAIKAIIEDKKSTIALQMDETVSRLENLERQAFLIRKTIITKP